MNAHDPLPSSKSKIAYLELLGKNKPGRDWDASDLIDQVLDEIAVVLQHPYSKEGAWQHLFESRRDAEAFVNHLANHSSYSSAALQFCDDVGIDFTPINRELSDFLRGELVPEVEDADE